MTAARSALNHLVDAEFEEGSDRRYHLREAQQLLIAALEEER